jgi:uncharacterized membrane protein
LALASAVVAVFFWVQGVRLVVTFFAGFEVLALGLAFALPCRARRRRRNGCTCRAAACWSSESLLELMGR